MQRSSPRPPWLGDQAHATLCDTIITVVYIITVICLMLLAEA